MTPPSVNEMDPYFSTHCTWRTYLVENSDYDPTHQGKYTPTQLYVTKNSIFISRYRPCTTQIRHTMWRCICILVRFCAFQSSMFSSSLDLFQIRKHTAEGTASVSVCVNVGGEGCGASLASPLSLHLSRASPFPHPLVGAPIGSTGDLESVGRVTVTFPSHGSLALWKIRFRIYFVLGRVFFFV